VRRETPRAARVHIALLTLVLISYGCWVLAGSRHRWDSLAGAATALIAAAGVIASRRSARFVVYAVALLIGSEWLWYVGIIVRVGYLKGMPIREAAASVAPGVAIVLVAGYCGFVAWRYLGGRAAPR